MELAGRPQEDARPRKTNKSLSTPSLELVLVRSQVGFAAQGSGRDLSTMMETLIRLIGDAHEPLVSEQDARFGHRASRMGEASHPHPPECLPTQVASHGDIVDCLEFDLTDLLPIPAGARSGERSTARAISPIRFQPPITIGSRCWTFPCWQMFPLVLTRSLRWKLTTFQRCTVDRGCV